jgi:hypothetical protein
MVMAFSDQTSVVAVRYALTEVTMIISRATCGANGTLHCADHQITKYQSFDMPQAVLHSLKDKTYIAKSTH